MFVMVVCGLITSPPEEHFVHKIHKVKFYDVKLPLTCNILSVMFLRVYVSIGWLNPTSRSYDSQMWWGMALYPRGDRYDFTVWLFSDSWVENAVWKHFFLQELFVKQHNELTEVFFMAKKRLSHKFSFVLQKVLLWWLDKDFTACP